jgi:hypothetical protein
MKNTLGARASYQNWGHWPTISDAQLRALAELVTPHVKWLAPEIVWSIAENNDVHQEEWSQQLKQAQVTRPESYLWAHSPCGLPGVRRHGSPDGTAFKYAKADGERYRRPEALCTDDNFYPKQLWHWAQWGDDRGKKRHSDYHLSHLFDHTDYNAMRHGKASAEEAWLKGSYWQNQVKYGFAELYTSVANYCYVPSALLKPTDYNGPLKRLLLQRAVYLYHRSGRCELFPHQLAEQLSLVGGSHWQQSEFGWDEGYTGNATDVGIRNLNNKRADCFRELIDLRTKYLASKKTA